MEEKKKKSFKGLIILIIGLLIIGGLIFGYLNIYASPEHTYKNIINNTYKEAEKYLKNIESNSITLTNKDKLESEINLNLSTSINNKTYLDDNYTYKLNLGLDLRESNIAGVMTIIDKNSKEEILDLGGYLDENKILIASKALYKNTISMNNKDLNIKEIFSTIDVEALNIDDYKYLVELIKKTLIDTMDKKSMDKSFEKLNKKLLIKMNYHFNKDNLNNMSNTLIERLTSDKRALSILSKILNMKESEVKDNLKESKDLFSNTDAFTVTIYKNLFSNKIIKVDANLSDNTKLVYENNVLTVATEEDTLIFDQSKKESVLTLIENDTEALKLTIRKLNEEAIDLDFKLSEEEIAGSIYLSSKKKSESSIFYDFRLECELKDKENQKVKINASGNASLYKTNQINIIDKENVTKIDDLTESDLSSIYNKLSDVLQKLSLDDLLD